MQELIDGRGNKWQIKSGKYREWFGLFCGQWKRGTKADAELLMHIIGVLPKKVEWKEVER